MCAVTEHWRFVQDSRFLFWRKLSYDFLELLRNHNPRNIFLSIPDAKYLRACAVAQWEVKGDTWTSYALKLPLRPPMRKFVMVNRARRYFAAGITDWKLEIADLTKKFRLFTGLQVWLLVNLIGQLSLKPRLMIRVLSLLVTRDSDVS